MNDHALRARHLGSAGELGFVPLPPFPPHPAPSVPQQEDEGSSMSQPPRRFSWSLTHPSKMSPERFPGDRRESRCPRSFNPGAGWGGGQWGSEGQCARPWGGRGRARGWRGGSGEQGPPWGAGSLTGSRGRPAQRRQQRQQQRRPRRASAQGHACGAPRAGRPGRGAPPPPPLGS